MPLTRSLAKADDVHEFTEGACHYLAVALHRTFGWDIHLVLDNGNPYWTDRFDEDNFIAAAIHAYAVDPEGRAWDILGHRPIDEMHESAQDWAEIAEYGSDTLRSEEELRTYVGYWTDEEGAEPIDRPLLPYDDEDIDRAMQVALRVFDGMLPDPAPAMAT